VDRIGLGKDLQRVTRAGHEYLLPQSSLPGAPPVAEPIGRGRKQNTKAAQEKRLAEAAAKREALAAKRTQPHKPRSDKGVTRGPRVKATA